MASATVTSDVTFRRATAADYPTFVRLFPELRVDDPVPDLPYWANHIAPSAWMAERDGTPVGYCFCQELTDTGYVRHVIVAPEARGHGVGAALMRHLSQKLRKSGRSRWCLNVKPENEPALRLYRSLGMQIRYASTTFRLPWTAVALLPEDGADAVVRPLALADDARVEASFGIPAGQLTHTRGPGRLLFELSDRTGDLLGFTAFAPAFPGAFPFRVKRPSLARPLLEGLRLHARDGDSFLMVVAEDDLSLADLLNTVGAEPRHEILHLAGELPTG